MHKRRPPTSLQFFGRLKWLDGSPLLDRIEEYRRTIFTKMLDTFGDDGRPLYNLGVFGRGKKNWKSCDLVLAALYCLVIRRSPLGNDGIIAASDEGQAGDDLALAKKLVAVNRDLSAEIEPWRRSCASRMAVDRSGLSRPATCWAATAKPTAFWALTSCIRGKTGHCLRL